MTAAQMLKDAMNQAVELDAEQKRLERIHGRPPVGQRQMITIATGCSDDCVLKYGAYHVHLDTPEQAQMRAIRNGPMFMLPVIGA